MRNFHPSENFHKEFEESDDELGSGPEEDILALDDSDIAMSEQELSESDSENDPEFSLGEEGMSDRLSEDIDSTDTSSVASEEQIDAVLPAEGGSKGESSSRPVGTQSGEGEPESVKRVIEDYDEAAEEDEVLRAIIKEIKKPRSKPPDITTEDYVVDLSFHPEQSLLAVGTMTGDVLLYRYANEENTLVETMEVHTKAIRDIEFSSDGASLLSTSRDKSIMITDVRTGKLKRFWDNAHAEPVYTMAVLDENLFATGDDEGTVKLWDIRERDPAPIFALKEVEDYISCLLSNDAQKYLLATSGDGFLTAISIPGRKLYVQSEPYEEELTTMGNFRNDSKVVVGTSKGNFYAFNWGQFGYHCDAFAGPMTPVNRMIPITERIAVTAGEEGVLRAMHMVPGRVLGIVGQHSLAVEAMDINDTGELIASSSHDNDIRFWNVKFFEDFDDIKYNEKPNKRKAMKHNLPSSNFANRGDFFADLA